MTFDLRTLDDLNQLGETFELECKLAHGQNGQGEVTEISEAHSHDLSQALAHLERDGLLQSQGQSRGKVYHLPGSAPLSPEQVFSETASSAHNGTSSAHNGTSSAHNGTSSAHKADSYASGNAEQPVEAMTASTEEACSQNQARDADGCLLSALLDAPIIDQLDQLSPTLREDLERRAARPRQVKRLLDENEMHEAILAVCQGRYVRLNALAELLMRNPNSLRRSHIDALVKSRRLKRAFPGTPTHEMQSYRTEDAS